MLRLASLGGRGGQNFWVQHHRDNPVLSALPLTTQECRHTSHSTNAFWIVHEMCSGSVIYAILGHYRRGRGQQQSKTIAVTISYPQCRNFIQCRERSSIKTRKSRGRQAFAVSENLLCIGRPKMESLTQENPVRESARMGVYETWPWSVASKN